MTVQSDYTATERRWWKCHGI